MGALTIRQATANDAPLWLDLFKTVHGEDYPIAPVYDPAWIASQLDPATGQETWVAERDGQWLASITLLPAGLEPTNPVMHLARQLMRPESFEEGSAKLLLGHINQMAFERGQWVVSRVLASDNAQQILFEKHGYTCCGFQPFKHLLRVREGALFYLLRGRPDAITRLPLSESLPQISELATHVLNRLQISPPQVVRDGAMGYSLQSDLAIHDASLDDFELWRLQAQTSNPAVEVSRGYHLGFGWLRMAMPIPNRALLGQREDRIVAGLAYSFDEHDRCLRIIDAFSSDDLSMGAVLQQVVKTAQTQFSAVYVEVDILATAPKLLKAAEQLGFVPIAYLPAFFRQENFCADVIKLVKLNLVYSLENIFLTSQARVSVDIIDHNFQDHKVGLAIINMLRVLPIFTGLGEGELRKVARLFVQKLYYPGEWVFKQGDQGHEAYVVMRGVIEILLEGHTKPVATMINGQIFGEQAFLDGAPRAASARASQPSILLVVQRTAFNELVQREPHLGMVVIRNTAIDLSNKLRKANTLLLEPRPL